MSTPSPTQECTCGGLRYLASLASSPVVFDKIANEWLLESKDGSGNYHMHFCFCCGGRLPESNHAKDFGEPESQEMLALTARLKPAQSLQEVLEILGPPDRELDVTEDPVKPKRKQIRATTYCSVAKSFDLSVIVFDNGEWEYAFAGKYLKDE